MLCVGIVVHCTQHQLRRIKLERRQHHGSGVWAQAGHQECGAAWDQQQAGRGECLASQPLKIEANDLQGAGRLASGVGGSRCLAGSEGSGAGSGIIGTGQCAPHLVIQPVRTL